MKHTLWMTALLLGMFSLAQFLGLALVYQYIDWEQSAAAGETVFKELPFGERPPLQEETSFLPFALVILIGTGLLLLLIRFKLFWLWKGWFFLAVVVALTMALGAFLKQALAAVIALLLGAWKVFRPNVFVHNFTELFIYGGLAVIFVPLFSLLSVSILLVLIALYDAYAVWKSKHMVTLAKSQARAHMFAGLLQPYQLKKVGREKGRAGMEKEKGKAQRLGVKVRTSILGGGDIGFPLIFAGVIMKELGLWQGFLIPLFAALGLAYLLWRSEDKKFYPAMPFIGAGCFVGLGVVLLMGMV